MDKEYVIFKKRDVEFAYKDWRELQLEILKEYCKTDQSYESYSRFTTLLRMLREFLDTGVPVEIDNPKQIKK